MVVGLGAGSTAAFAVRALAQRHQQVVDIPTSERRAQLAAAAGIPLASFAQHLVIDMTLDGAGQVGPGTLHLIKGRGGALLREKTIATASRGLPIAVDETKQAKRLGVRMPVPAEVVMCGMEATRTTLETLGAMTRLRLDHSGTSPFTNGANWIGACSSGPIAAAAHLEERIKRVVGVVDCSIFIDVADLVFVAAAAAVRPLGRMTAAPGVPSDQ